VEPRTNNSIHNGNANDILFNASQVVWINQYVMVSGHITYLGIRVIFVNDLDSIFIDARLINSSMLEESQKQ
jgi:hypothetical protein